MNEIFLANPFIKRIFWKMGRLVLMLLVVLALTAGWLPGSPASVEASAPPQTGVSLEAGPTPVPGSEAAGGTASTSPVIGILILLAPLVFLVWKSRKGKNTKITASCCLPVVDENDRPFQIPEDEQPPRAPTGS
jgi:hypothetical protein